MGKTDAKDEAGESPPVIRVALGDFPLFDGTTSLESFLQQCERLSQLGGIPAARLPDIIAARCRGLAQQVVEGLTSGTDLTTLLRQSFSQPSTTAAATRLSGLKRGDMSTLEYSLEVKKLVRSACPEFFDAKGKVKDCCGVSYQAALYRHLLVGLNDQDKLLLSRQGASTFDAAVKELLREEALQQSCVDSERPSVHWAECIAVDSTRGRSETPPRRSADRAQSPRRYRDVSPGRREGGGGRSPYSSPGRAGGGHRSRYPSPGRRFSAGGSRGRSPGGGGGAAARSPRPSPGRRVGGRQSVDGGESSSSEDEQPRRGRQPRCYACRGFGHLKRHCPNVHLGGRW